MPQGYKQNLCPADINAPKEVPLGMPYGHKKIHTMTYLKDKIKFHATMVKVLHAGVLIIGDSLCGKSETVLDLLYNGHQIIADDVVEISKDSNGQLSGQAVKGFSHFLHLRGIGIIDIKEIFGEQALCQKHSVDLGI